MKHENAYLRTLVPSVLALALVAGGCSRKQEPEPVATSTPPPVPAGATGAQADWSWADQPASAQPPRVAEEQPPSRIEPAPPPRRVEPPRTQPRNESPEPTNRLSAPKPAPPQPPPPVKVAYTANAGTQATFRLTSEISSETANVGDPVSAILAADVTDGRGHVVLPAGTELQGTITEAVAAKKAQKKSFLAYSLTQAHLPDGTIATVSVGQRLEGKGWTKKDGAIIGGSAAGGALLGQVLGHDTKSTAAGAVVGGAIASGVVMSKKGEDVTVEPGQDISLALEQPVTIERLERTTTLTASD